MKIFLINTLYHPNIVGGAERSVQFLAESLVQEGYEAVVVTTIDGKDKVDYLNGVKVYYLSLKNLYHPYVNHKETKVNSALKPLWHTFDIYNPLMAAKVEKIIVAERPDLVHTNNIAGFSVAIWQLIKKLRLPLVHTLRDYYLICSRKYIMFRNGQNCESPCFDCKAYSFAKRQVSNSVDVVIGISQFILDRHLNLNYFSQTSCQKVIYNSYQAKAYSRTESSRLRLGYLGRIEQAKGFYFLLQTLQKLSNQNWELNVGGRITDEKIANLRSRYPLPNVNYLGFVKPEVFFSEIDVLVVPSLWQEPLGRIVLEAYAYGVPVIGSNRGGIPEIIDSGSTGFVFNPEREETLLEIIEKFMDNRNLSFKMGKNALTKSHLFSNKTILNSYMETYKNSIITASK
ncbi:MAG: glycosyltransferase family 4 protein [Rivularia sp. (in: Bacteria)]|nr:glycosyltransferase family 4 protein [Rivularia sp. MS3]